MINFKIIVMIIAAVFAIALPLAAVIWWKKRSGLGIWPFVSGAIIWLSFAIILESIVHYFCIGSENAISAFIQSKGLIFALYVGLAAGIFEETGRLFAFKVLLRKRSERETSIAYGIGHGGIEVFYVLGLTYIMYILVIAGLNFDDEALPDTVMQIVDAISPGMPFVAIFERLVAMAIHIGLSMIVYYGARKNIRWYFAAIALHTLADIPAGLCQYSCRSGNAFPIWTVECAAVILAIISMLIGLKLYKRMKKIDEAEPQV